MGQCISTNQVNDDDDREQIHDKMHQYGKGELLTFGYTTTPRLRRSKFVIHLRHNELLKRVLCGSKFGNCSQRCTRLRQLERFKRVQRTS